MIQEWRPSRVQYELLQIDGITEEGKRGRGHWAGCPKSHVDIDPEGTKEREWSRSDFGGSLDVRPVVLCEVEVPDLLSVGRKQRYGVDGTIVVGDYI